MLFITIAFFVLCQVFAKLMFLDKIAGNEQFQGIINGGAADIEAFFPDVAVQRLRLKMVVAAVYLFQNMEAFVGFAKVFVFQIGGKDVLHFLNLIRSVI